MKKLILILFLLISPICFGEQYKFKISGVDDIYHAKEVSTILQDIFDKRPTFNDNNDMFIVNSDVNINLEKFKSKLLEHGYTVIFFNKSIGMEVDK